MSEQEAVDMIEFFKWIDGIDLNGFERIISPLAKDKIDN